MPFRDREWEDLQRDCDFFPAYTDWILGVDTRPEVADEPGLHPQIYDSPQSPSQRLYGLPYLGHHLAVYDPVRDVTRSSPCLASSSKSATGAGQHRQQVSPSVTRELLQMFPNSPPALLPRCDSSLESLMPTPTPTACTLPTPDVPVTLLRPGELAADPRYLVIPRQERSIANKNVMQAWSIINSDAAPAQKTKAMRYLQTLSLMVATKRQEYQDYELRLLEAQEAGAERGIELAATQKVQEKNAETTNAYAICDISQLPAYVQSRLSQLWACAEIVAFQAPPTDQAQFNVYRQAQQYLMAFKQSVPPKGRQWVGLVIDGMLSLRSRGHEPLTILESMPSVESTYGMGPDIDGDEHFCP